MSWTPALKSQYDAVRSGLVSNYINNLNVVQNRTIPAALDYPNAPQEVANSKAIIQTTINALASESDALGVYLKDLNEQQGNQLTAEITEKEQALRKIEHENRKYEEKAETREAQAEGVLNKYEGNYHSQPFPYAPWDINFSTWFSYSIDNQYINLNPTARSGLLFIAFFLGFACVVVLGAKIALSYYHLTPSYEGIFGKPGTATGTSMFSGFFSGAPAEVHKKFLGRRF